METNSHPTSSTFGRLCTFLYEIYIPSSNDTSRIYMPMRPSLPPKPRCRDKLADHEEDRLGPDREPVMLDVAYLVIGAVFLGLCAAYAVACSRL